MFLYIVPLKQGLKQKRISVRLHKNVKVFIHSSIKTRIETYAREIIQIITGKFLYIVPLKQGLKLRVGKGISSYLPGFYT